MGHSPCEFIYALSIAEIYLFTPDSIGYLHTLLHSENRNKYIGQVVRYGRSRSFKVIRIGTN